MLTFCPLFLSRATRPISHSVGWYVGWSVPVLIFLHFRAELRLCIIHVIIQACHHAKMSSCKQTIIKACHYESMSLCMISLCKYIITQAYHHGNISSCKHIIIQACHHASMPLYKHAIIQACH